MKIVADSLANIRDRDTPNALFRQNLERIGTLLLAEATKRLPTYDTTVETPLTTAPAKRLLVQPVVVPILRAGLGFVHAAQELMPSTVEAWSGFSPRPDSSPGVLAAPAGSGYALEIHGNGVPTVYGGWRTHIPGLSGGQHYRFRARALPLDIASPREAVTILLRWRGTFGDQVAPDYVWKYHPQTDGSLLFDRTIHRVGVVAEDDVERVITRLREQAGAWKPAESGMPQRG